MIDYRLMSAFNCTVPWLLQFARRVKDILAIVLILDEELNWVNSFALAVLKH